MIAGILIVLFLSAAAIYTYFLKGKK